MHPSTAVRATLVTAAAAATLALGTGAAGAETVDPTTGTLEAPAQPTRHCDWQGFGCPGGDPHPGDDSFPNESSFDYCSVVLATDPETGEQFHRDFCSTLTIDWGDVPEAHYD